MDRFHLYQLPDEVSQVVANRSGVILSAQTVGDLQELGKDSNDLRQILKSDFFSGLQKQSLPEFAFFPWVSVRC